MNKILQTGYKYSLLILFSVSLQASPTNSLELGFKSTSYLYNKTSKLRPELLEKINQAQKNTKPKNNRNSHLVLIDAIAKENPKTLLNDLVVLGLQNAAINGRIVSGFIPINALGKLENIQSLNEVKPNQIITLQGSALTKGDISQKSDLARQNFNVDGSGITIGVISDSYNCLDGASSDKQSKDLPEQAHAVEEAIDCARKTDEGRALMQIIHDVAPGADLIFFSGSNGLAKTANGILDLAFKHKVDVIIDDYKSLSANYFQEDSVSQAIKRVVKAGVTYVTAAGNSGRNSYQSNYNEFISTTVQLNAHDFNQGPNVDIYQRLTIPEGVGFNLLLQWNSPAYSISGKPGTQTDLDMFIFDESHSKILASSTFGNIGRDPTEILQFFNPIDSGRTKFDLMITKASGKSPSLFKYIILNSIEGIISEYQTNSSAVFGHANSKSAITIGAANYLNTPAFGQATPLLQSYSSAGGTALALDLKGNLLSNSTAPQKPDVIAPDNVNTTFFGDNDTDNDGKPNISGSSAAAPHAAGVAALLLESNPQLQPKDIKKILQSTAIDIMERKHEDGTKTVLEAGFDFDSGYGLINAEAAVDLARDFQASPPEETTNSDSEEIIVNDLNQTSGGGATTLLSLLLFLFFGFCRAISRYLANTSYHFLQLYKNYKMLPL